MTSGPFGVITTLARKELRFYVRDPRQRLVWTGTVIFVGLAVAGTVMGTTGLFDVRDNDWAPLAAPVLVLFVGLPIALNLFGWERNAASYLFVLPAKPRQLLLGKNLAVATALAIETAVLAVGLSLFTGFWTWTWLAAPLTVAAVGSQLAVGERGVRPSPPYVCPREGDRCVRPINGAGLSRHRQSDGVLFHHRLAADRPGFHGRPHRRVRVPGGPLGGFSDRGRLGNPRLLGLPVAGGLAYSSAASPR